MKVPRRRSKATNLGDVWSVVQQGMHHGSLDSRVKRRKRRRQRRGIGGGAAQKNIISHRASLARAEQRRRRQRGNARRRAVRGWDGQAAFTSTLAIHTEEPNSKPSTIHRGLIAPIEALKCSIVASEGQIYGQIIGRESIWDPNTVGLLGDHLSKRNHVPDGQQKRLPLTNFVFEQRRGRRSGTSCVGEDLGCGLCACVPKEGDPLRLRCLIMGSV